jgi:hypothetical protein
MLTDAEETGLCVELLEADPDRIEEILNNYDEGHGNYSNDIIGFALMGLALNLQRIDRVIQDL